MHPLQLLSFLHQTRYVANGFHRELLLLLRLTLQRLYLFQFGLLLRNFTVQGLCLLLQQQRNDPTRLFLLQQLGNGVDGQAHVPQKADDLQPPQITVGIQPPSSLGQFAGDQDTPGIIVLYRPHGNAAQLCQLACGVF